jgi:hypothetical protein
MFRLLTRLELERSRRTRKVVSVAGVITEIDPDQHDSQDSHQILTIVVEDVLADPQHLGVFFGQLINIAIRYGDANGLHGPIPNLVVGEPLKVSGVYVPLKDAYPQPDGDRYAVIHFTHRPVGWVEYQGKHYE